MSLSRPNRRRSAFTPREGFTLIELLVVIAIIAILAAILFPVFAQAREKARQISCLSNVKEIGLAALMYAQDYDETLPGGWNDSKTPEFVGANVWRWCLLPYIQKNGKKNIYDDAGNLGTIFICPTSRIGVISYGYNGDELETNWAQDSTGAWGNSGVTLAAIKSPGNLIAFADAAKSDEFQSVDPYFSDGDASCNDRSGKEPDDPATCGPFRFDPAKWQHNTQDGVWNANVDSDFRLPGTGAGDWMSAPKEGNGSRRPYFPHGGKSNAVFADGHAKAVAAGTLKAKLGTPEDIWHNHD